MKLCDGRHEVKEIASIVAEKFRRDPSEVYSDTSSYLEHLTRAHFLFNNSPVKVVERAPSLKRLHLNIIEKCNLKCIHCGVINGTPKNGGLEKKKVFEIIDELSENDGSSIAISGGEPLLHKDCFEILRYALSKIKTSLSTNATLIDESRAQKLSSLDIGLQISLDGLDANLNDRVRGKGAFDKILRGIKLLQKHGAGDRISLFSTVMKHNIGSVPDVIKLAEWLNIPSVRFLPVQRLGTARSSWNEICPTPKEYAHLYTYLYRELPPTPVNISGGFQGFLLDIPDGCRWCHLGDTLAIDSSGDIYPCSLMIHPDFHIGNINHISPKEALKSDRLKKTVSTCESREETINQCRDCPWKHFCQASCPGSVYFRKGTLWDSDDLCDLRQKLYPELIFDMAEKKVDSSALKQSMACEG